MKKAIIILSMLLILALAGALYGTYTETDEKERETAEYVFMDHFPDTMPDMVIDPMAGMPVL